METANQTRQLKVRVIDQRKDDDGVWQEVDLIVGSLVFDEWCLDPFNEDALTKGLHVVVPAGLSFAGSSMTSPLFEPEIIEINEGGVVLEGWDGIFCSIPAINARDSFRSWKCGSTPRRWIVFLMEP